MVDRAFWKENENGEYLSYLGRSPMHEHPSSQLPDVRDDSDVSNEACAPLSRQRGRFECSHWLADRLHDYQWEPLSKLVAVSTRGGLRTSHNRENSAERGGSQERGKTRRER